jgi:hypothetical protein
MLWIIPCIWSGHWFWQRIFPFTWLGTLILFAECSVCLLWTLILTTNFCIWNGVQGGCDRWAEDAYSSMTPESTFVFVEGPCCPTLDLVFAFWWHRGLRGRVVKTSVSYHNASQLQPASVRILPVPMWLCEKVCQFTCGRSVVSPQIHCRPIMHLGSLFHQ